ncbi:TRAFAC clade GTPase domain-containing protein [Vallitalea guaymasensis]|uniref:TRAFAC clade GTPase domain-containing protein n=1 Tax=Vallitalea guaymasensis TaxID=1185412 RepID=UPI000DE4AE9A|nr:hypothetical protein [Vallitalea guaymasensis]
MNNFKQSFIMGLPNAGKTTYLAALYYSIANPQNEIKIRLNKTSNDTYLSKLSLKWVEKNRLERTKLGDDNANISIEVIGQQGDVLQMRFPDLSGETFQNLYEKRELSTELVQYIKSADGILLFVNVDDIKKPEFISNNPIFMKNEYDERSKRDPKKDDPIQVQLIELLQVVQHIREYDCVNIGIVLSAWDLIPDVDRDISPEEYIHRNMCMLWQFLQSNKETLKTRFWGVSAQGGKIDDDKLLDFDEPINRIIVVDNNGNRHNDITIPIFETVGEVSIE